MKQINNKVTSEYVLMDKSIKIHLLMKIPPGWRLTESNKS